MLSRVGAPAFWRGLCPELDNALEIRIEHEVDSREAPEMAISASLRPHTFVAAPAQAKKVSKAMFSEHE